MKKGDKAFPEHTIEVGGETLTIVCNWKTIYNFEKVSGRSITSLSQGDFTSVSVAVDFVHAAVGHQNRKYTKDWLLENMHKKLWLEIGGTVIPSAIKAALMDDEQVDEQKKEQPASNESQTPAPEKAA